MLGDYLSEFAVVVKTGTISGAAAKLDLSQSALTRHLAALEAELGAKLIERGPAGIRLTDDGRYAYEAASQIVDLTESLQSRLTSGGRRARERQIVIGGLSDSSVAARLFEVARARLVASGYTLSLRYLQPRAPESIERVLTDRTMDVVLTYEGQAAKLEGASGLHATKLYDQPIVAVFEREHPMARLASTTLASLRGCTFSRVAGRDENTSLVWDEFARLSLNRGFAPRSHTVGYESAPSVLRSHAEYVLICEAGGAQARRLEAAGKVAVPVSDLTFTAYAVARADDAAVSRLVQEASR